MGRISYGIYLVHWPVYVYVDEVRTGSEGWNLALTRVGLTAVLSIALYAAVERPIRRSARPATLWRTGALAVGAALLVITVARSSVDAPPVVEAAPAVLASPGPETPAGQPDTPRADSLGRTTPRTADTNHSGDAGDVAPAKGATVAPDPGVGVESNPAGVELAASAESLNLAESGEHAGRTTIAVFGDSVPAWLMRDAASAFVRRDVVLVNGAHEACDGAVDLPVGRDRRRVELRPPDDCEEWTQSYPGTLASYDRPVEIGLLVIGQAPTVDRFVDERWAHPCEGATWYLDDVRSRIEFLRSEDVAPVLALPARFGIRADFILPDDYAERMSCVRTGLSGLAFELQVDVVDLDGLLCFGDECDGRRSRDGIHIDREVANEVHDELVDLTLATR